MQSSLQDGALLFIKNGIPSQMGHGPKSMFPTAICRMHTCTSVLEGVSRIRVPPACRLLQNLRGKVILVTFSGGTIRLHDGSKPFVWATSARIRKNIEEYMIS
jgi:hypothetical protein